MFLQAHLSPGPAWLQAGVGGLMEKPLVAAPCPVLPSLPLQPPSKYTAKTPAK